VGLLYLFMIGREVLNGPETGHHDSAGLYPEVIHG
jgi:hypothetical protein